jgi:hypothetical protein
LHGNNPLGAGVLDRAITLDRTGYPAPNPQFIHSYSTASQQFLHSTRWIVSLHLNGRCHPITWLTVLQF